MLGQPVIPRRVQRPHGDGVERRAPERHRLADDVVHVPPLEQVVGLAVVRAEQAVGGTVLEDQREQRLEVPRRRALADHDPHPQASLLQRLVVGRALVVAPDPGGEVRVQGVAGKPGRVPVDVASVGGLHLGHRALVSGDDGGEVHHLREPERGRFFGQEQGDVGRGHRRAARLERAGRDARRHHDEEIERNRARRGDQRPHAVEPEHVRDLVGVEDAVVVPHGSAARAN